MNNRKSLKAISLMLCMMLLAGLVLTSCGSDTPSETTAADTVAEDTTAAETEKTVPIEKRDYDGYSFKALSVSSEAGSPTPDDIWVEAEIGDVLNDALYNRNRTVEEVMNVKITQAMKDVPRNGLDKFIMPLILAGDPVYDIALITFASLNTVLFAEGANTELGDIDTLNLDAEWWDQDSRSSFSIKGKEYTATGAISLRSSAALYGILFNTTLVKDYNLESPYKLIRDGSWTFEKMNKMMEAVKTDLNGDGQWDDNDRYGLIATNNSFRYLLSGTGAEIVVMGSDGVPELNTSEHLYNAVNTVFPVASQRYLTQAYAAKTATLVDFFFTDQALFFQGDIGNANKLRGMESDFGIIPAPKLDEAQDRYYCPLACSTATSLIVPTWNSDLDRTGYITDALGYYSMELVLPAFFESTLEAKAIRDDDSVEMLELMNSSKMFVINDIFNFGKSHSILTGLVTSGVNNFASQFASYENAINADIDKFIDSIS